MKNQKGLALITVFLLFGFASGILNFQGSRKLWLFWNSEIQNSPQIVQLCYQKIQKTAKQENWQLLLLSEKNYTNFIEDKERFNSVVNNKKKNSYPALVDYIRLTILADWGGLWIDISCVLFEGLSWLQHLDQNRFLIANKKKGQYPQVILFYNIIYQSRNEQYTAGYQEMINYNPGYEMWFVYCKPKAQLMSTWRDTFAILYQQTYEENYFFFRDTDTYLNFVEMDDYLIINEAIYYLLQKKQLQLDREIHLFGERPNANQYYNLWGISSAYGPLTDLSYGLNLGGIMMYTLQQIEQYDQVGINFFVKMTASKRKFIAQNLDKHKYFMQKYGSFDAYLQSGLSKEQCLYNYFIVEGSAFGQLLKDSQVAERNQFVPITHSQVDKWVDHCDKKLTIIDKINLAYAKSFLVKLFLRGTEKRYEYKFVNKLYSSPSEQITSLLLSYSLYFNGALTLIFVIGTVFTLMSLWLICCRKRSLKNVIKLKPKSKAKNIKIIKIIYLLMVLLLFQAEMKKFYCGQNQNHYFQLVAIGIIIYFSPKAQKSFSQNNLWFQNFLPCFMRTLELSQVVKVFQVYFMGRVILSNIVTRNDWLPSVSFFVLLIGYALFRLAENLQNRQMIKSQNFLLETYLYSQPYLKYIAYGFFILTYIMPNIQFLVLGEYYAIRYLSYLTVFYVIGLYLAIGYQLFIELQPVLNSKMSQVDKNKWKKPISIYLYLVACGIYSYYVYRNFFEIIAISTLMVFDPTLALIFVGLNTQYHQKSLQKSKTFQQFLNKEQSGRSGLNFKLQFLISFLPQILLFFLLQNCDKEQIRQCRLYLVIRMLILFVLCIIQVNINTWLKVKIEDKYFEKFGISSTSFQQFESLSGNQQENLKLYFEH